MLREKLVAVRDKVYMETPAFSMVGVQFLCPELCKEAKFIETIEDMSMFGIRTELKEQFYNVITDTCLCVHRPQQRRL